MTTTISVASAGTWVSTVDRYCSHGECESTTWHLAQTIDVVEVGHRALFVADVHYAKQYGASGTATIHLLLDITFEAFASESPRGTV